MMPLLGGLAVYLVYRLGKRVFDPATGLAAAALMALMNGAIGFSFVGRVDHHGLVAPVVLGIYLCLLASLEARTRKAAVAWGVACGLLAAVSAGSWIVTPALYFLPVPLTLALARWSRHGQHLRPSAWSTMLAALCLVSLVVLLCADLRARPFALYQPSLFTVLLFGAAAAGVLPLLYRTRVLFVTWGAMLAGLVLLTLLVDGIWDPLVEAARVAAGSDVSYLIARESGKLYTLGQMLALSYTAARYTNLFLLTPVMILAFVYEVIRSRDLRPGTVLLAVFFPWALFLLLLQQRFGEYAAPAVALLMAWAVVAGARKFRAFWRVAASRLRAWLWAVLLVAGLLLALSPLVTYLFHLAGADQVSYLRQLNFFGQSLAGKLPAVEDAAGRPTYGLLTGWDETHPLLHATRVPVVTSSFATPEALRNNRMGFRLLLTMDEESAWAEMVEKRIRFVVASPIITQVKAMAAIAGLGEQYIEVTTGVEEAGYFRHFQPLAPFANCLHTRMYLGDGGTRMIGKTRLEPLAHFRLFMDSQSVIRVFGVRLPQFKAFEVVAGARLEGMAEPGQKVRLRLSVRSNIGRSFLYRRETNADAKGMFEIVVPYPTEGWKAPTVTEGPYRIKIGDRVHHVEVSERDVQEGRQVGVSRQDEDEQAKP